MDIQLLSQNQTISHHHLVLRRWTILFKRTNMLIIIKTHIIISWLCCIAHLIPFLAQYIYIRLEKLHIIGVIQCNHTNWKHAMPIQNITSQCTPTNINNEHLYNTNPMKIVLLISFLFGLSIAFFVKFFIFIIVIIKFSQFKRYFPC